MEQSRHRVIETGVGRFEVVFELLEDAKSDDATAIEAIDDVELAEASAIDELRRISAELAESPTVSYTST